MQKVNLPKFGERSGVTKKSVVIAPNLRKESVFLDKFGNVINPRTKQIIQNNQEQE